MRFRYQLRTLLLVTTGCAVVTGLVVIFVCERERLKLIDIYNDAAMITAVQNPEAVEVSRISGKSNSRGLQPLIEGGNVGQFDISDLVIIDSGSLNDNDIHFLLDLLNDPSSYAHLYKSCAYPTYQLRARLKNHQGINADVCFSFQCDHALFLYDGKVISESDLQRGLNACLGQNRINLTELNRRTSAAETMPKTNDEWCPSGERAEE